MVVEAYRPSEGTERVEAGSIEFQLMLNTGYSTASNADETTAGGYCQGEGVTGEGDACNEKMVLKSRTQVVHSIYF